MARTQQTARTSGKGGKSAPPVNLQGGKGGKSAPPVQRQPQQQQIQQAPVPQRAQSEIQINGIRKKIQKVQGVKVKRSNKEFADDDQIDTVDLQQSDFNIEQDLVFRAEPLVNVVKNEEQLIQFVLTILPKEEVQEQEQIEIEIEEENTTTVGVDLICVIDRSGSMQGNKINTVIQTLHLLLDILTPTDRLCVIQFTDNAQRLTPLKTVTEENKQYFRQAFQNITAGGGTKIHQGTALAFQQIEERTYQNNVTSVFLLSDGQDSSAVSNLEKQLKKINAQFTLNTFGFGHDHDSEMLASISNLKNGQFYYVENISLLDEFFGDALGGLYSVIGQDLQISIDSIARPLGNDWQLVEDQYIYKMPQISQGQRKDFVFEIQIPEIDQTDENRTKTILTANLRVRNTSTLKMYYKDADLQITYQQQDVENQQINPDVQEQINRVKTAKIIEEAKELCNKGQFQQAQEIIIKFRDTITEQALIDSLNKVLEVAEPKKFQKYGGKAMTQWNTVLNNQQGMEAEFADDKQIQNKELKHCNKKQKKMVEKIQKSKSSK